MCPEAHLLVFYHALCHKTTAAAASPPQTTRKTSVPPLFSAVFMCLSGASAKCLPRGTAQRHHRGPGLRSLVHSWQTWQHTLETFHVLESPHPPLRDTHHTDIVRCREFVPTQEIPHYSHSTSYAHTEVSKVVRSGPPVCHTLEPQG